ncbi:MAG: hypothetical protein M1358_04780 [Chloroflexi bacterium]|nr:hypothetical protein [Chloroflexota bacterium]
MEGKKGHPTTIDEYISQFPEDVQHILVEIRTVIKESAPDAMEKISYQMPAFYLALPLGVRAEFHGFVAGFMLS